MEQTKALNALEPFLALHKSATSPRAAADLVTRATSAPNTYLFAELLQTPAVQSLAGTDLEPALTHLQIFSYGTYADYVATPNLPPLNPAQELKLRQLSLLTLARARENLTYDGLRQRLGLDSARELEDLVVSAVYAGLLDATLDPHSAAVQVHSVAPLRDLAPGAVPPMMEKLTAWSGRCTDTLLDLERQIERIKAEAARRAKTKQEEDAEMERFIALAKEEANQDSNSSRRMVGGKNLRPKRPGPMQEDDRPEAMEVDEEDEASGKARASRRKL